MTVELVISQTIHCTDVPEGGLNKNISATPEECRKLAQMLGVIELSNLEASFVITRWHRKGLKIKAEISADVVQNCVVSLETISSSLKEDAQWCFKPEPRASKDTDKDIVVMVDPLGEDPADILLEGKVDLGELLAEHLCLMIDPFIRSPAVDFETFYSDAQTPELSEASNVSPFAILKQIGKNEKN